MIKRYGFGQKSIRVGSNTSINIPDLVEREDGDYYKAADVDAILESIGAGGVNGRITGKTLDQHRAEFEKWAKSLDIGLRKVGTYYVSNEAYWAWLTWKAAKGIKE